MVLVVTLLTFFLLFQIGVNLYVNRRFEASNRPVSISDENLYFAYGANMSIKYLTNVRNIRPLARSPGQLAGYKLTFGIKGVNALEPGFANIQESVGSNVEGVVYSLGDTDFSRIVGSEPDEYKTKTVFVTLRSGETVEARVLIAPEEGEFQPSRRYLQIMIDGAKEAGLSPEYVARMESSESVHKPVISEIMGTVIYTVVLVQSHF